MCRLFMEGQGRYYRFAIKAMVDIMGTIFVPAIAAALAGQWLDERLVTGRWFFLGLMLLSFVGTAIVIVKKVRAYGKEYQKLVGGDGAARG